MTPTEMTITVNREERTVPVRDVWGDGKALDTTGLFLCRHRTGQKLYPATMRFWKQPDGSYKPNFSTVALNRQAQIVAWRDTENLQPIVSRHSV